MKDSTDQFKSVSVILGIIISLLPFFISWRVSVHTEQVEETKQLNNYLDKLNEIIIGEEKSQENGQRNGKKTRLIDSKPSFAFKLRQIKEIDYLTRSYTRNLNKDSRRVVLIYLYESGLINRSKAIDDKSIGLAGICKNIDPRKNIDTLINREQRKISEKIINEKTKIWEEWDTINLEKLKNFKALFEGNVDEDYKKKIDRAITNAQEANKKLLKYFYCNLSTNRYYLNDIDMTNIFLENIKLHNSYLNGTNFTEAKLNGATLRNSGFRKANFTDAKLKKVNFRGPNRDDPTALNGANFTGAELQGAIFTDTNLSEANFTNADLSDAKFTNADLEKANFKRAKHITPQQIKGAKNWEQAKYDPDFRKQLGL
ncbi:pentapeptide repeat-containing protein [Crocosphaera sp.]|uniref:pentapeptide repeat-containing protein n=1 Tax=Crocosphaera sp. TaxID=2729996 RepID=UPI00263384E1|nr:pentapeptide repeat-containing protein [Crocosphaera sp.]MDJ0582439.1 pentapeptide repeat-containing protein [Crocosphaera sp.]